jgi:hypothetical protein
MKAPRKPPSRRRPSLSRLPFPRSTHRVDVAPQPTITNARESTNADIMNAIGEIKANQQTILDDINKIKAHINFLDEVCLATLDFTDPHSDSSLSYSHLYGQWFYQLPPL